jgi:type I site-specific restriction endonuclease
MLLNEADTCRRYVVPKLKAAGWETEPHRRVIMYAELASREPTEHE